MYPKIFDFSQRKIYVSGPIFALLSLTYNNLIIERFFILYDLMFDKSGSCENLLDRLGGVKKMICSSFGNGTHHVKLGKKCGRMPQKFATRYL